MHLDNVLKQTYWMKVHTTEHKMLTYKQPAFALELLAILICCVLMYCFID